MKKTACKILFSAVVAAVCGCSTVFGTKTRVANPNNVYRFAENTEVEVLVEDAESGTWKRADYKLFVPMGYYIGSGIE